MCLRPCVEHRMTVKCHSRLKLESQSSTLLTPLTLHPVCCHPAAASPRQAARNTWLPLMKRTTCVNYFYRALGMKVGDNVMIDTDDFLGFDLIEVRDDAVLDKFCGITAMTFEAGKPSDKFPTGKMTLKRAGIGAGAVIGAHSMVVCSSVADGAVVQPCSASNNPPAAWRGSRWPQTGSDAAVAAKSQDNPLGVWSGLLAMIITDFVLAIVSYPFVCKLMPWLLLCPAPGWQQLLLARLTATAATCAFDTTISRNRKARGAAASSGWRWINRPLTKVHVSTPP